MPRLPRPRIADFPLHVTQRGVDRADCFRHPADFVMYLRILEERSLEHRCAIHAYVLMTNHVHLLVTPSEPDACSRLMKDLGQRYSQHFNRVWERTGPLWDGRFKSSLVETDRYFLGCQRYIEMNPVRAGMVSHPSRYRWSSYRVNAYDAPSTLISPHGVYRSLGSDMNACRAAYRALFDVPEDPNHLRLFRDAARGGFPIGSESFIHEVERRMGRRLGRKYRRWNAARTATVQQGV